MPLDVAPLSDDSKHSVQPLSFVGLGPTSVVAIHESLKRDIPGNWMWGFESRRTVGGRTLSIDYGGRSFNLGAEWWHGHEANLYWQWLKQNAGQRLAKAFNVPNFEDIFISNIVPPTVWVVDREGRLNKNFSFRAAEREVAERLYWKFKNQYPGDDIALSKIAGLATTDAERKLARGYEDTTSATWMAMPSRDISCDELFDEPAGSGGFLVNGRTSLIAETLIEMAKEKGVHIVTECRVREIIEAKNYFKLNVEHRGKAESFLSRVVNVNVPLPVLQRGDIQFRPSKIAQQIRTPARKRFRTTNMNKILVPLRDIILKDEVPPNHRIWFRNQKIGGTFFMLIRPEHSLEFIGRDFSQLKDLQAFAENAVAKVFPHLGPYDAYAAAPPKLVDFANDPDLAHDFGGSFSACRVGQKRFGKHLRVKPSNPQLPAQSSLLLIGGESWTSNRKGASTMEAAVPVGKGMAAANARAFGISKPRRQVRWSQRTAAPKAPLMDATP